MQAGARIRDHLHNMRHVLARLEAERERSHTQASYMYVARVGGRVKERGGYAERIDRLKQGEREREREREKVLASGFCSWLWLAGDLAMVLVRLDFSFFRGNEYGE